MKQFEIWYKDLNSDAQERFLEFSGVKESKELNEDLVPLAIIDLEEVEID